MFARKSSDGFHSPMAGVELKATVHGERTLMAEFILKAGSLLPEHTHMHEQTGYLISGHLELTIDGETHDVRPGDSWCIAGDAPHKVSVIEDSVAVEVFSPVREDFLAARG